MIIIAGSNSGLVNEIIKFSTGSEIIVALYNKNKPKFKKKNLFFFKQNFTKTINKDLIKFIEKRNDKKITIANFVSIKKDMMSYKIQKKDFLETFDVNVFGFFIFIKTFLPLMIQNKWGRIINISSTGGLRGDIGTVLYTSSKNATLGMFNVLAKEYSRFNITFNSISLGSFNTGMYKKLPDDIKQKILSNIPSHKNGNFRNIFNGINFIKKSDYVNGSNIKIDGGM
tara:strand:- start:40 stop:720 length:681 start_codon:yes stop_codon:yes gene_type:complete